MIGPFIVGLAVWCAAGLLTVATPDSAAIRFAVPAPWWILPVAVAVAALVGPWRSRPITALPALLATLPWWPVPLPPLALMWTGPLAWVPLAAAIACAVGLAPIAALGRTIGGRS